MFRLCSPQLRAIAEIAILAAFIGFQKFVLSRPLLWNHVVGFSFVLLGVLVVLQGPFTSLVFGGGTDAEVQNARMLRPAAQEDAHNEMERL